MKTKEQLNEDVGLVRDVEAWADTKCADDYERKFREALFLKAYVHMAELEIPHVRRINEALCKMDFPTEHALALRRAIIGRLAAHHELRKYRGTKVPTITPPAAS
jgi:hypothetical protein